MINSVIKIFVRDLQKLEEEINLYDNESDLWLVRDGIANSAGNLCLHIIGNLNHFIGGVLGKDGYVRWRDLEFSAKNVSKPTLIAQIEALKPLITKVLTSLSLEDLADEFPLLKHGEVVTTELMLLHLLAHFEYHLGQINYHRRLI